MVIDIFSHLHLRCLKSSRSRFKSFYFFSQMSRLWSMFRFRSFRIFCQKNCDISNFRSLVGNTVDVGGPTIRSGCLPTSGCMSSAVVACRFWAMQCVQYAYNLFCCGFLMMCCAGCSIRPRMLLSTYSVMFSVECFLQLQLLSSVKGPTTPAAFVDVAVYSVVI